MTAVAARPRVAARAGSTTAVSPAPRSLQYLPGLDGLRAIAVVAVLLFHAGFTWIPGGYLGVEVFFVISGYLITLLLVSEFERTGRISLRHFWLRRARRLLPALFALLVVVGVVSVIFLPSEVGRMRGDLVAAFFYCTNWYLIATQSSYFDQLGRPPLLQHLWSLAVEEQFYLVWPVAFYGLLRVFGRNVNRIATVVLLGAGLSVAAMVVWYDPDKDPSRVYYGTDTRASALLLGATLALFWRPRALARGAVRHVGPMFDLVGLVGLIGIVIASLTIADRDELLYRGGFVLASVSTLLAIAAVTHPGSVLGRYLLGNPLFVWIGKRSYGLYIWHWPIFALTRPGIDLQRFELAWWQVQTLRFTATVVLTEVSFRLLEEPIRAGALGRWFRSLRGPATPVVFARRRFTFVVAGLVALLVVPAGVVIGTRHPEPTDIEKSLRAGQAVVRTIPVDPASAVQTTTTPTSAGTDPAVSTPATDPATAPTTVAPPPPTGVPVIAIGDSVMLGAAPALDAMFATNVVVNAKVGRQFKEATDIATFYRDNGYLGKVVVIHLGNNGDVGDGRIDELMAPLAAVPLVIFLNDKVPRGWEAPNNELFVNNVSRFPNALLVDWKTYSEPNPGWFYSDSIHLRPEGQQAYADLIAQVIRDNGITIP
jgi:peptidoglycan/LPS O-acetylase OafA/YrhL